MTNDYKKNLLDYILGRIPKDENDNVPQFQDSQIISLDLKEKVADLGYYDFIMLDYLFDSNNSNFAIIGNGCYSEENPWVGIIIILDENFQILKILDHFDSGTKFRVFEAINIDENNNIYAVDISNLSGHLEKYDYRFIMLNNFLIPLNNEYTVKLKASYYFPSTYTSPSYILLPKIKKIINESVYAIPFSSDKITGILVLKVNVGSSNEWIFYRMRNDTSSTRFEFITFDYQIRSENSSVKIIGYSNGRSNAEIIKFQSYESDETNELTYEILSSISIFSDSSLVMINENLAYFGGIENGAIQQYDSFWVIKNKNVKQILKIPFSDYSAISYSFAIYNNQCFFQKFYLNYLNEGEYYVGTIIDEKYFDERVGSFKDTASISFPKAIIKNNYNLYYFIYYAEYNQLEEKINGFKITPLIFNFSNYNGKSFEGVKSLIPNSFILYSNEKPVFARNLYNKTLNRNNTTTSLEIPNNFLNNSIIDNKKMFSFNNNEMIDDTTSFVKNIYETVYLNFINSLLIENRNDINNIIINNKASIFLNNSINEEKYDNSHIYPFIIIEYQDGTTSERIFDIEKINDLSINIIFTVEIDKPINLAKIISNDKTLIYQEIDLSNLEVDKSYKIKQKLEVL